MTLSIVGSSAWVSGTGAVTPTNPTGLSVGDLVVLTLVSKYDNAVLASDPAGWDTPGTPAANTGRPTGTDNGNTRMRVFYKVWQTGDSMPTLSPSPNNVSTVHATAYRSTSGQYDVVAMPLADDTTGSPLAVTSAATSLAVGDMILTDMVLNGDAPTWGTTTVTASGITFGSVTTPTADLNTTAGTDLRMRCMNRAVSAGSGSPTITCSTTLAGTTTNAVGTVNITRIREVAATPPAAPTSLSVTGSTGSTVSLSWTDNATTETGFRIEWSDNNFTSVLGSHTIGPKTGTGTQTDTVTGLTAGTQYWFRVYAYNASGDSTASNTVTTTTPSGATIPWRNAGAWSSKPLFRRASGAWVAVSSLAKLTPVTSNVTFVAAATTGVDDTNSTSHSFNKPAGALADIDLIIGVMIEWTDTTFPTLTLPSGASLISQRTISGGMNGGQDRITVWGKTVGSETSYACTHSSAIWGGHHGVVLRGWDPTMFFADMWIDGFASVGNDSTVDPTGDQYPAGAMAVWIVGNDNDGSGLTHTPPTGFTERVESQGCTIATMENPNTTLSATGGTISTATTYAVELLKILPA